VPEREFQVQILSTATQWRSGLATRLNVEASGISLYAIAAFDSLFSSGETSATLGDIVTDECGQTWWTELTVPPSGGAARWALMRHDPRSNRSEALLWLGPPDQIDPRKLWLTRHYLFILDQAGRRVLALSRENFQPLFEVPGVDAGVDIDFDGTSTFYALDASQGWRICRYPLPPKEGHECFALAKWQKPAALAVAPNGLIYILDAGLGRFIRYSPKDNSEEALGDSADARLLNLQPAAMDIDPRGVIFVATNPPAHMYQYAPDGSVLADAFLPDGVTTISGIGFDAAANVYLATNEGVARFNLSIAQVGQQGLYYTRTLDNGKPLGTWHRLALKANLPPKTSVGVQYVISSDGALQQAVDAIFNPDASGSVQEKIDKIEALLGPRWSPPEQFAGATAAADPDMLFLRNQGRYLWIKLILSTSDENNRPSVSEGRIYYPRLSYLRYLPAIYRDDPISAAFLERFLSMFETVFRGVEGEVGNIFRYFDPALAPAPFLPWLASWVHLAVDEGLSADRVRRLIERGPVLFQRKGTPQGLLEFLEIYTGAPASLTEFGQNLTPLVLGVGITLGKRTLIASSPVRAFRVGDSSIVGFTPLRAQEGNPAEAFQTFAQRFEVVLQLDPSQSQLSASTLQRILDEQKPAHTSAVIRFASGQASIGEARLGVNTVVGGAQPYRVGYTRLGEGSALSKSPPRLWLDRGAWVGSDLRLEPDR
jgi:phage tail-like protein